MIFVGSLGRGLPRDTLASGVFQPAVKYSPNRSSNSGLGCRSWRHIATSQSVNTDVKLVETNFFFPFTEQIGGLVPRPLIIRGKVGASDLGLSRSFNRWRGIYYEYLESSAYAEQSAHTCGRAQARRLERNAAHVASPSNQNTSSQRTFLNASMTSLCVALKEYWQSIQLSRPALEITQTDALFLRSSRSPPARPARTQKVILQRARPLCVPRRMCRQ